MLSSIFPQSKYTRWYYDIISNACQDNRSKKQSTYYEKHHIIPKCLGGNNNTENLVLLTAKEHYICHLLLVFASRKTNNKQLKIKMTYSLFTFIMSYYHDRYVIPSHMIIKIRKMLSSSKKGIKPKTGIYTEKRKQTFISNHWTKKGLTHPLLGKKHKKESITKMSLSRCKYNWVITDPKGNVYSTTQIKKYCLDNKISYDSVFKWVNKGTVPCLPHTNYPKRQKITGWVFTRSLI